MASNTKRVAARDFTDAGTGRNFTKGGPVDAADGEIANYDAAGLLEPVKADPPASGKAA